jgi:L-arabinose transport system ATP-binding protein
LSRTEPPAVATPTERPAGTTGGYYLEFQNVSKSFPGVRALDGVSFGVREGSVHALVGENGAGKSTLLKILSGVYTPSEGGLRIAGQSHIFRSTREAIDTGIAVIYQELFLVPDLSVAENIFLGHLPACGGVVNRRKLHDDTLRQLELVNERIPPETRIRNLPIGQRQMIEIAKALTRGAKIIAFDEPTSSLSRRETEKLFELIAGFKARGHVILYVSHRMEEIFRICDSATVFRDGRHVATFENLAEIDHDTLVRNMVGRELKNIYGYTPRPPSTEPALEVEEICGKGVEEPASVTLRKGEILGIFGLVGAGRSELMKLIYGAVRPRRGLVKIYGQPVRIASPGDANRAGLMLCSEDRKAEGIVPIRSVLENINISARRNHAWMGFFIHYPWEKANATEHIRQLGIKTPGPHQAIVNLSGGNQQKAILARWLSEKMKVLILDEPTRGIDVGAKNEIYSIMYRLAERGIGIVMVSSDLPEVIGVSDRILVMREGRMVREFTKAEANETAILKEALPTEVA